MGVGRAGGQGQRGYTTRTMSEEDLRDLFGDADPFSDFFYQAFSGARHGARRGAGPRGRAIRIPGEDIEQEIEIALEDAYTGATRVLEIADAQGTRRVEARIPAGAREGSRIRLAGQGGRGVGGGPDGDLYLVVHVRVQPPFELKGGDVHVTVSVPLSTCLLGARR